METAQTIFFRIEIGASLGKCLCHIPKANKILGKVKKFQVNTISFSKVMTFLI